MKQPVTKAQRAKIEQRRVAVASLLTARVPYRQIAERLDISIATVSRDVAALLAQWAREQRPDDRNRWRATELMKLDEMEMALTPQARRGHEGAVDRTLRIMERRAKLLGLDEPDQMMVNQFVRVYERDATGS